MDVEHGKFSEEERKSLERIARIILSGGRVPERFKAEAGKWYGVISRFLLAVNRENGSLNIDPFRPLPVRSAKAMEVLQMVFMAFIKEKMDSYRKPGRRR
jgi:hypothetical protein